MWCYLPEGIASVAVLLKYNYIFKGYMEICRRLMNSIVLNCMNTEKKKGHHLTNTFKNQVDGGLSLEFCCIVTQLQANVSILFNTW